MCWSEWCKEPTLKVKDLLAVLQQADPEAEIIVTSYYGGCIQEAKPKTIEDKPYVEISMTDHY